MCAPIRHIQRLVALGGALLLPACRAPAADGAAPRAACRAIAEGEHTRVNWIDAAPPVEATDLANWCATVGPPVLLEAAPPPPSNVGGIEPGTADSLLLVSWNVHVGGGSLERLVAEIRAGRLTGGRPPAQFVLLLQEAYRAGAEVPELPASEVQHVPHRIAPAPPAGDRVDVVRSARALGLALLYVPSMRNGPGVVEAREDRGNAILSTLPLGAPTAIELPLQTQRRVAVQAEVEGRASTGAPWRLRVVSAHLDHRAAWRRPLATLGGARLEQARALAAALGSGAEPLAIGSDLNTWSAARLERAVPYLRRQFPSGPPEPRGSTFTLAGVGRRLDHMFFRVPASWNASVRIAPDRYGSDHNPLVAWIRFGPPAHAGR